VRLIAGKLAEKVKRSKAVLRSQHIARAMLGFQRFSADYPEIRNLLRQLTKRIAESDRTRLTAAAIADSVHALQSMTGDVPEVQELVGELAKKVATTAAELSPVQVGHALFGLQSLSSSASIIEESSLGIDVDEVQFLLSALWDKVKVVKGQMPLSSIAMGLQGLSQLNDPTANNLKQYLYAQVIRLGNQVEVPENNDADTTEGRHTGKTSIRVPTAGDIQTSTARSFEEVRQINNDRVDIVSAVRALRLNDMRIPRWLAVEYMKIEDSQISLPPSLPQSRGDKLVLQRYKALFPNEKMHGNSLLDGFRLDMNFPDIKLNVELDGPGHRLKSNL